ncbi:MAG: hypothetical protein P8Y70_12450 [Candidatus Lokiarchaeota archaeon]
MLKYSDLKLRLLKDVKEIIKYIQIGTSIPIWNQFMKYILLDFEYFGVKSLIVEKQGNLLGHCLLFNPDNENLYFGYFGVLNHNINGIEFLIHEIIKYAENNGFKKIIGPINIPVIIFGWGFMVEGSSDTLFIGKPVNPPLYQNSFFNQNFQLKHKELTFLFDPMPLLDPKKLKKYNFSDYEYFYPKNLKEVIKYKNSFMKLHTNNLPSSARITPNLEGIIENYGEFILKYGYPFMLGFVRYKPTDEIIGTISYLPNPFRTNEKGIYDSCVGFSWVVEPEHRGKGITLLMYGYSSSLLWDKGIRCWNGPVGGDNEVNIAALKNLGGKISRTHLILQYNF